MTNKKSVRPFSRTEYEKFRLDYIAKTFVQERQFNEWLKEFFYLNEALHSRYDRFYQQAYYIKFNELINYGIEYAFKIQKSLEKGGNNKKLEWYKSLTSGLTRIKSLFNDEELEYIKYRRHGAGHIFQDGYEHNVFEDGGVKDDDRILKIEKLQAILKDVIIRYGSDMNFDIEMHQKVYPIASGLYSLLEKA